MKILVWDIGITITILAITIKIEIKRAAGVASH